MNLLKTLPESRRDKRYEEGSPEDLQTLESYFSAAARERAGINAKDMISLSKSSEIIDNPSGTTGRKNQELCSNEANLLASFLSLMEYSDSEFKLEDGLKVSG